MLLDYKKINNITGWVMFAIATIVYALTVERTASYWDCGEFIAVSYKLEVPHPPGAPLFLLLGRLFSFLAMGDVTQVAYWINMMSVLSSGFCILFLFWSITLLGKKLFKIKHGEETKEQTFMLVAGGIIGSLAYTFTDSFWFSAVEAEVYAMSSFFTAIVFWAILRWEQIEDENQENKWLILIAYLMGLSIGVHILNLVAIPALGLIYYFKKFENVTKKGLIIALLASGFVIVLVNDIIIPGLPSIAGKFELFFVNSLGLPFGSGVVFFIAIFIGSIVYGVIYSVQHQKVILNTALLCLSFILIGYMSYSLILIRSNFNPPIDENDPENVMSFVSYLKREQYGSRPLLHGQYFTAKIVKQEQGAPIYVKGKDKYEISDYRIVNTYDPKHTTILPRAYSNNPQHVKEYRNVMGLKEGQKPTFADNIVYMFKRQLGKMYMRYFMWNFAGRESDIQDANWLAPWESSKDLPELLQKNKGRNNYYMLPLLLGIIGLFFQFNKDEKGFSVVAMLFFMTGMAVVLFLNTPPIEPRERDYIYAGSFYAFAMWLGFGMMAIADALHKLIKNRMASIATAFVVCLLVPGILAAEGWNDHDRSNRYFSVDSAKNFLASCAPNAVLFTGGDNDTFPLWYVQEVEGFRTDVRVIVLSYFNTDWYINQMKRRAYKSEPLPFSLPDERYRQGTNDYVYLRENPNLKDGIDASVFIKLIREDHKGLKASSGRNTFNIVPSKTFRLKVDKEEVLASGIIPEKYKNKVTDEMVWNIKRSGIEKKDLLMLDLIVSNNWERPIYFNHSSMANAGHEIKKYLVQEGNAYRLLPIDNSSNNPRVNSEVMYDNVMNNFHWRELNNPNSYYNEDYRKFVQNHRSTINTLAKTLINEGDREKAKEVVLKSLELMPDEAIPYDYISSQTATVLLELGEDTLAYEMGDIMVRRAEEELAYLQSTGKKSYWIKQKNLGILDQFTRAYRNKGDDEKSTEIYDILKQYYK